MAPKQMTLASEVDAGFALHRKATRRDVFLAEMDQVVPWAELCALIEPHYPKVREDGGGRRPIGLERMLRIHFLQQWYALSDPGVEEALYDSEAMRRFVGIDLGREAVPDESTVLQFRHLLEQHGLAEQILAEVNGYLVKHGMKLSRGTIVDATIIAAAASTKNKAKARDPEMHQTKKGNQWYFGMKAHIGVDVNTGLVHTVTATAANVADVAEVPNLLRGYKRALRRPARYAQSSARPRMHTLYIRLHAGAGLICQRSRPERVSLNGAVTKVIPRGLAVSSPVGFVRCREGRRSAALRSMGTSSRLSATCSVGAVQKGRSQPA